MAPPYSFETPEGKLHVVDTKNLEVIAFSGKYVTEKEAAKLRAQIAQDEAREERQASKDRLPLIPDLKIDPLHISHPIKQFLDNYPKKR